MLRHLCFWALFCMVLFGHLHAQSRTGITLQTFATEKLWFPQKGEKVYINSTGKLTLLVLLSPECPMCISYTTLLKKISANYDRELQVTGLIPGKAYHDTVILQYAKNYELNFPLYVDKQLKVSKYLKAEVTPEAFLFDAQGFLVYSGAIDNWLVDLGKKRPKADQHYLMDALQQTLSGNLVTLSYARSQGCLLNEY